MAAPANHDGYFKDGHMGHVTCEEPVVAELKDEYILTAHGHYLKGASVLVKWKADVQ